MRHILLHNFIQHLYLFIHNNIFNPFLPLHSKSFIILTNLFIYALILCICLWVHVYVYACGGGGKRLTSNIFLTSSPSFLSKGLPLNLKPTDSAKLIPGSFSPWCGHWCALSHLDSYIGSVDWTQVCILAQETH